MAGRFAHLQTVIVCPVRFVRALYGRCPPAAPSASTTLASSPVKPQSPAGWRIGEPESRPAAADRSAYHGGVVDLRECEQCAAQFEPRREHARFCSAECRDAWNRAHSADPAGGESALQWSIVAMNGTADRLSKAGAADLPRGFAVISEAVWWVTIVDATMVRHHPEPYDRVLAGATPAGRRLIEDTLSGLRFVRNRMGHYVDHVDFLDPRASGSESGDGPITRWRWKSLPEPTLTGLSPRGQAWELGRYRAYQARLAGHSVGEVFGRTVEFLNRAASSASFVLSEDVRGALSAGSQ